MAVFGDKISIDTKVTRLEGPAAKGARLAGAVPHGHKNSQTCVAGLRCSRPTAPWVVPGGIDRVAFGISIETQLAATLPHGDVVIADNLKVHDSAKAKAVLAANGAWFLFVPPYAPDLNPVEWALSNDMIS